MNYETYTSQCLISADKYTLTMKCFNQEFKMGFVRDYRHGIYIPARPSLLMDFLITDAFRLMTNADKGKVIAHLKKELNTEFDKLAFIKTHLSTPSSFYSMNYDLKYWQFAELITDTTVLDYCTLYGEERIINHYFMSRFGLEYKIDDNINEINDLFSPENIPKRIIQTDIYLMAIMYAHGVLGISNVNDLIRVYEFMPGEEMSDKRLFAGIISSVITNRCN